MAHHIAPDGSIYVDTAFIQRAERLPGMEVRHMGFGEFTLKTPKGEIEFDRMRGKDFPGQSGRSHKFYPEKLGLEVIRQMEAKGLSEKMASVYAYDRQNGPAPHVNTGMSDKKAARTRSLSRDLQTKTAAGWDLLESSEALMEGQQARLKKDAQRLLKTGIQFLTRADFQVTNSGLYLDHDGKPVYWFHITDMADGERVGGRWVSTRTSEDAYEAVKDALGYGLDWNKTTSTPGQYEVVYHSR